MILLDTNYLIRLLVVGSDEAARLWNQAGRARNLRVDALIAGTALAADATVATGSGRDFGRFAEVATPR